MCKCKYVCIYIYISDPRKEAERRRNKNLEPGFAEKLEDLEKHVLGIYVCIYVYTCIYVYICIYVYAFM
jgi:hypothetical protein